MRDFSLSDTIAAIATPPGEGAIAVIRLSGGRAITVVDKLFMGKNKLAQSPGGRSRYGKIVNEGGEVIDEVVVTIMRAPQSYTGEDTVEISCHGGYIASAEILRLLLSLGVREAERGEFTLRAFLNGRMDLTRAEAVADLVSAKGELRYKTALKQLSGDLFGILKSERDKLKDLLSVVELGIDFAEEDIELSPRSEINYRIKTIIATISDLIAGFDAGRIIREGYRVAISGKVNVGKSSLLNKLLGYERAIVTPIAGTTRDTLSEPILINGLEVHLTDTAGFRDNTESMEREGINRAKRIIETSDLVLFLLDPTADFTSDDKRIMEIIGDEPKVVLMNKIDLFEREEIEKLRDNFPINVDLNISAFTGENLQKLREIIYERAIGNKDNIQRGMIITNRRHYENLKSVMEELSFALGVKEGDELIAEHLRRALNHLGEISGEVVSEEILNNIFDNFCIGK